MFLFRGGRGGRKLTGGEQTTSSKQATKVKKQLDGAYSYLGGNAFGRDKKGNIKNDVPGDMITGDAAEYQAYVYYEFEIA